MIRRAGGSLGTEAFALFYRGGRGRLGDAGGAAAQHGATAVEPADPKAGDRTWRAALRPWRTGPYRVRVHKFGVAASPRAEADPGVPPRLPAGDLRGGGTRNIRTALRGRSTTPRHGVCPHGRLGLTRFGQSRPTRGNDRGGAAIGPQARPIGLAGFPVVADA